MSKKCYDIWGKILQVLILPAIAFLIVNLFLKFIESIVIICITIFLYIAYLLVQKSSSMYSFLFHKTDEIGILDLMQSAVQTAPLIEFHCECYHIRRGRSTRRSVTYEETSCLPYYSSRDVSGLFQLNKSGEAAKGKPYVKLMLIPEINFADELTYMDYDNFRTQMYNINRPMDKEMEFTEIRSIPGLNEFNFVCIGTEPCCINIFLFIFFMIIPLAEFYKCYINLSCLEQTFKIRKLISTRYDLNQAQAQYQYLAPSFNLPIKQYVFESSNYNYINNNFKVKKPTNQEIHQAAKYKDKIPKYKCVNYTNINGNIKVGIVKDDPCYCSANYNIGPPPNCIDMEPQFDDNSSNSYNNNSNSNSNNSSIRNNVYNNVYNRNKNKNMNMNMNFSANDNLIVIHKRANINSKKNTKHIQRKIKKRKKSQGKENKENKENKGNKENEKKK